MQWESIDKEIHKYIEYILLPNLIAFTIFKLYNENRKINDSFLTLYNTIKTYVNIIDENQYLVYRLVKDILNKKYNLEIVNLNPIILEELSTF